MTGLRYAVCSDRGPVRSANQDAVAVAGWVARGERVTCAGEVQVGQHDLWNICVLDGLGGYQGGAVAALVGASVLSGGLQELQPRSMSDVPPFVAAFDQARGEVMAIAQGHPQLDRMGATAASVVVGPDSYAVTNVGDVRVYRYWRRSYLTQLSVDDRVVGGSNAVTQTLGPMTPGQIDVHHCAVGADEATVLLMCSDGLTDALPDDDIRRHLEGMRPEDLLGTAEQLVAAAVAAGGEDNMTVAIIAFTDVATAEEGR